jgi:hypothetical protein
MKKQFPKQAMERSRYRSGWRSRTYYASWLMRRWGSETWRRESAEVSVRDTASGRWRPLPSPLDIEQLWGGGKCTVSDFALFADAKNLPQSDAESSG